MSGRHAAALGGEERFRLSDEVVDALSKPTISIEDAGRLFFSLKPEPARAAAKKGEIPSIKVGRKILVPTASIRRMLELDGPKTAA